MRRPVALHEQFVYWIPGGQNCQLQGSFTGLSVTEKYKKELQFQQLFSLSMSNTHKEIVKPYAALHFYLE